MTSMPKAPAIADSAEPKSISELQQHGLNVIPCGRGADSVDFGIKHIQGLAIGYVARSSPGQRRLQFSTIKRCRTLPITVEIIEHGVSSVTNAGSAWERSLGQRH
jgi:hypothetical protein